MLNLQGILSQFHSIPSPLANLSKSTRGYLSLFGGFLIHLILGTFYLWSTLNIYVTSYLNNNGQDYKNSQVNAVFPFMMLAINICNPLGVPLAQRIGFRFLAVICSIVLGLSIILSSYFVDTFGLFALFYGFTFGFASGLVYMIPFNTSYLYYPHRKGLVSGVISAGFGFGATIFLWVVYYMVNPTDQRVQRETGYFSKEVTDHLPGTLFTLGWIYLCISFFGALLIERPNDIELAEITQHQQQHHHQQINHIKEQSQQLQQQQYQSNLIATPLLDYGYDKNKDKQNNNNKDKADDSDDSDSDTGQPWQVQHSHNHNPETIPVDQPINTVSSNEYFECLSTIDSLSTSMLYKTIAMALMFCCYGIMMIANFKPYAQSYGYSDSYLTIIATVGSITNGLSRLMWGTLNEHLTFKQIVYINLGIQILVSVTMGLAVKQSICFFIWMICVYFTYGGWYAVLPAVVAKVFGNKVGTSVYGITFTGFTLAGWTQFFLVRNIQLIIGWNMLFYIFTGIQIIAVIAFTKIELNIDWKEFYERKNKRI